MEGRANQTWQCLGFTDMSNQQHEFDSYRAQDFRLAILALALFYIIIIDEFFPDFICERSDNNDQLIFPTML